MSNKLQQVINQLNEENDRLETEISKLNIRLQEMLGQDTSGKVENGNTLELKMSGKRNFSQKNGHNGYLENNKTKVNCCNGRQIKGSPKVKWESPLNLPGNEEWFRDAIEQSPVSIIITDAKGKIVYINPFYSTITGYKAEETLGKHPSLFKSGFHNKEFYADIWDKILEGKSWEGRFYNKRKDGSFFWEKAIISPVKNAAGEITNFIAVKMDITRQKMDANEIRKQYAFSDQIINAINEGVLVESNAGDILFANPAFTQMTGFSQDELFGKSWEKLITKRNLRISKKIVERRKKRHSDIYELELQSKKGKTVPVLVSDNPIIENGEHNGLVTVITDIGNLKKQEKELKRALKKAKVSEKLKSAFLANMSHEVCTPLNAILGFARILKSEQDLDKATCMEYLTIIEEKGNELLEIISDIINISRIKSKMIDISRQEFELHDFLLKIYNSFQQQISSFNKELEFKLIVPKGVASVAIYTDEHWLSQIIKKLLENAYKFTSKGKIELGYTLEETNFRFFVRDTGIGISKKDKRLIFEQFSQVEISYSRNYGGTGIGLNICKDLVKLLDGKIWVDSEPGIGSTFYFEIRNTK